MSTTQGTAVVQLGLPGMCAIEHALACMAESGMEERGAVYTKREVVDFILDLVGYKSGEPLLERRLLEPSFGGGDFLIPAIERLIECWSKRAKEEDALVLLTCIRAVELHAETFHGTRTKVLDLLRSNGISPDVADQLAAAWLIRGDFLLTHMEHGFDVVVGNPPYVRQELIPEALMAAYRSRYRTIYDRADLYVPFIERSLQELRPGGQLGFICSDRWMKNRYGAPLREYVAGSFHFRAYIDMVDTPAFHSEVSAYPGIVLIERGEPGPTRMAVRPQLDPVTLARISSDVLAQRSPVPPSPVRELPNVARGADPWVFSAASDIMLLRRLEADYVSLEESGCKVGIGVATGADKAFIGDFDDMDVEPDRKLRLVTTKDIQTGRVEWKGLGIINPFADSGKLVDLRRYPKLAAYLESRRELILARHVAKKNRDAWFRTIDRIYPDLVLQPKLLIPDIKGEAHIVYEEGKLYPHHNLYYVTSDTWDLRALQAVLLSGISRVFIANYSTQMRGGYLRFQAQYLRRIRVPRWETVTTGQRARLTEAAMRLDLKACNEAVADLYGLTDEERLIVQNYSTFSHGA